MLPIDGEAQRDFNIFGSGLGLSINNHLANKLQHKMNFQSDYGKGSCFSLVLDYNQIPRILSYKDPNKVRLSKPNNMITKKVFEKSKSYKNPLNLKNSTYSVQEVSNFGNQISISGVSDDKKTNTVGDDRLEFHYIHSPEDSKREHSIYDKSHNISSFSKYIQNKKEEERFTISYTNQSAKNLSMNKSINYNLNNNQKILVVDDNRFTRFALIKLLKNLIQKLNLNLELVEGYDGIDILKLIIEDQKSNNNLIKCVLTDECMEYIDGSKSLQILREMESYNRIRPVAMVCITSFDDENSKEFLIERGADFVLNKPCSSSDLEQILKNIFEI